MANLVDLLGSRGLDVTTTRVVLMRHKDKRYPRMVGLIGKRALTLYQAVQDRRERVGGVIVGFFGHRPRHALLLGAWRVDACMDTAEARQQQGLLGESFEDPKTLGPYFHQLTELNVVADLQLKLEVEWGRELAWRRVLTRRPPIYPCTRLPD